MPEQQASPSCSQLPPSTSENPSISTSQPGETDFLTNLLIYLTINPDKSVQPESAKRVYLSLLPPPQLIDLILAIDANRDTQVFPLDLNDAIEALRRPRQSTPASAEPPSGKDVLATPPVKTEPVVTTVLPPLLPSVSIPISQQAIPPTVPPPSVPPPAVPPLASTPVLPPQYKPPPHKPQPQVATQMYPHTHVPYYASPMPPNPQISSASSSPVPPPAAPPRHPLFTSTPLSRDPTKPFPVKSTPPPTVVSSRDDPNAMPSYEEMIVEAITDVGDIDGTAPKVLFAWMAS